MRIVICGAGEVGSHAAEVLVRSGHSVTVIDRDADRLRRLGDTIDARTVVGNCSRADILVDAGTADADMVVAATNVDEVNLLTAALARRPARRRWSPGSTILTSRIDVAMTMARCSGSII